MQTLKIEYKDGLIETIENCVLLNASNDEATEFQIETGEGVKHIPFSSVRNLLEVQ